MGKKKTTSINLSEEELSSLKERIESGKLTKDDVGILISVLDMIVSLKAMLQKKKLGILRLLKIIFGVKTEKATQKERSSRVIHNLSQGRQGRNGRDDYPGAEKISVPHPTLKAGDECPECHIAKLKEDKPAVDYDWKATTPISLDIYLLQRLLCPNCKSSFIAPSPIAETSKTVDDSLDEIKVGRCDRNASANSTIACLRFMFGVPHYRLEKIQGSLGIALPSSTQYKMLYQVYLSGVPIFEHLLVLAAQDPLFHADDTSIKILDWLRGKGPPTKTTKQPRKKATTTSIVSKSEDGRQINLYFTGAEEAGAVMASILDKRQDKDDPPLYMSDGLAANNPGKDKNFIKLNCLDHARRQFYDIQSIYPEKCTYVLDQLKLVYKADKEAKEKDLSPEDRLLYHQEKSQKIIEDLGCWMSNQLQSGDVEENSDLGRAMGYFLSRWTELTEFYKTPGVPLSNALAERSIKKIITHRKNSLFYKTENGAHVGDVIQSLITTCEANGVNCFKYLSWIQENRSKVVADPEMFLPWKFKDKI